MIARMKQANRSLRAMLDDKARSKSDQRSNTLPFIRVGVVSVPRRSSPHGGVDHGSDGRCLLESRDRGNNVVHQLVWFSGHWTAACGVRGFGRVYSPARLALITALGFDAGALVDVQGGRITPKRLSALADEIDRFFGAGACSLVETGSTIVVISPDAAPRR